jgi:hypothetical protein
LHLHRFRIQLLRSYTFQLSKFYFPWLPNALLSEISDASIE